MKNKAKPSLPPIVACSMQLYTRLLRLAPPAFGREYSNAMLQDFKQYCLDAYRHRRWPGVLLLWLPMLSDLLAGILAEHFDALQHARLEGRRRMQKALRKSLITIFVAFVVFGLPWLFFARLKDPLSWWLPIVQAHPSVGLAYDVIQATGLLAFLMMLIGGVPIMLSTLKQALLARRRDVLALLGISVGMALLFTIVCVLVLSGHWGFDPNGGIFAIIALVTLVSITITLARAVMIGELSARVLRLSLLPLAVVPAAMAVGLVATIIEAALLFAFVPGTFSGGDVVNWLVADGMMVIATGTALLALRRGILARRTFRAA